jgi:diguanylate cyclase (GGDEF)-like protein
VADKGGVRRTSLFHLALGCVVLGLALAVLGTGLVVSRQSSEQAALDRSLSTVVGEKAALVDTELQRLGALTLLTARIPPFAELYADAGSQAAAIAAVAGPGREINQALTYLYTLYPDRLVSAGYVDVSGAENARVVRGVAAAPAALRRDVSQWPAFAQGVHTPVGQFSISRRFLSPVAGVQVVAATTPVAVDGRVRAYVELDLATSAIARAVSAETDPRTAVAVIDESHQAIVGSGEDRVPGRPHPGLGTAGRWRYAVHEVQQASRSGGHWYVLASEPARSTLALTVAPTQSGVLGLAALMFLAGFVCLRRARATHAADLAAEQQARRDAELRSRVDPLTGLYNRRHATETIEHELARTGRQNTALGVLMFDIDRFKAINDTHGHAGGDAVIVEVARRLTAGVREWDTVARIGGEEFCVILPAVESEAAVAELGNRLRAAIAERTIQVPRGAALPVTISAGAALLHDGDGSAEAAIDRADRALYAAKRRGRNRLCTFTELDETDLRAEQPESLQIAQALALTGDLRQGGTDSHSRRVADLSAGIARQLGLTEDDILRVRLGGWLRDVGKLAVPETVLNKPGALTEQEWDIMRTHPVAGDQLLRNFPELAPACPAVRHHHERYDGTGYPDRLAGDTIPLEARIVAAADAFTAMTTDRPHRAARGTPDAIAELRRHSGTQFDPRVITALLDELLENPAATTQPSLIGS